MIKKRLFLLICLMAVSFVMLESCKEKKEDLFKLPYTGWGTDKNAVKNYERRVLKTDMAPDSQLSGALIYSGENAYVSEIEYTIYPDIYLSNVSILSDIKYAGEIKNYIIEKYPVKTSTVNGKIFYADKAKTTMVTTYYTPDGLLMYTLFAPYDNSGL